MATEIDLLDTSVEHTERWVLLQSGQFVQNIALDRVLPLGIRAHMLEILWKLTVLFEFPAHMADQNAFTYYVGLTVWNS